MKRMSSASSACDHFEKNLGGQKSTKARWPACLISNQLSRYELSKTGSILPLAVVALALLFLPGAKLRAQTGSINGTVADPSGAVIFGAKIQVINEATGGVARETTS